MLRLMPKLDAFDLHMTNTLGGPSTAYQKIFDHIADEVKLPLLTQVFFRGIPASEKSLLAFIDNHQSISDLTIDEMELTSGSWKRVIRHISQLPDLSRLNLSNLFYEQHVFNCRCFFPQIILSPISRYNTKIILQCYRNP